MCVCSVCVCVRTWFLGLFLPKRARPHWTRSGRDWKVALSSTKYSCSQPMLEATLLDPETRQKARNEQDKRDTVIMCVCFAYIRIAKLQMASPGRMLVAHESQDTERLAVDGVLGAEQRSLMV